MRQLEMKKSEMCELSCLMMLEEIENEIETERYREMGQEILQFLHKESEEGAVCSGRQFVWNGGESEVSSWCRRNIVYDESPKRRSKKYGREKRRMTNLSD